MSTAPAPPGRLLVVTADDFGIGLPTSQGIIDAAVEGPVTATSALVVAEGFEASLALLDQAPRLEVGLHLALTGRFRPLAATRTSGFVGRDGHFGSPGRLLLAGLAGRLARAALVDEIVAQADRFLRLTGRAPTHVDGHHHAHEMPVVREVVAELATTGALPGVTRITVEPPGIRRAVRGDRLRRSILDRLGRGARGPFHTAGLVTNDSLFGMLLPDRGGSAFPWARHLAHLPGSGAVEWMVHPGRPDPGLRGLDEYVEGRAIEWQVLTAPRYRAIWDRAEWPRGGKTRLRASAA